MLWGYFRAITFASLRHDGGKLTLNVFSEFRNEHKVNHRP